MVLEVIKENRVQPDLKAQEEILEFPEKRVCQVKLTNYIRELYSKNINC